MPTDPYIASRPDDVPRHQQNIPAGIAVPPAESWVQHRPGEVGPDEHTGAFFGRPGPNIGFALTLVERQKGSWQLSAHEYVGDAGAVVAEIAMKRAAGFGRAPVKADVDLAAALLGYDRVERIDEAWCVVRSRAVREAEHNYAVRRRLVDAVPDSIVELSVDDARGRASEWRAGFAASAAATTGH
jgi:hypothetical protein